MWDPDGHTLSFRSSWWRLDVEVVVFFDGKKTWWKFWKNQLWNSKKSLLSKQNPIDVSMGLVYMFTYMKAMKINDSCRYTILWIVWDCLPPPQKKKSNWKVQPAQTRKKDLCWPFPKLPFGISTASILTKDLGPRRGVIFEHLGQTPYIEDKLIPLLMTGTLIMGIYSKSLRNWVDEFIPGYGNNGSWSTRLHLVNQSWRPIPRTPQPRTRFMIHLTWSTAHKQPVIVYHFLCTR